MIAGFIFGLFSISFMLFLGLFYTIIGIKRAVAYPPKMMLKRRAIALAGGGAVFMLLGIYFTSAS